MNANPELIKNLQRSITEKEHLIEHLKDTIETLEAEKENISNKQAEPFSLPNEYLLWDLEKKGNLTKEDIFIINKDETEIGTDEKCDLVIKGSKYDDIRNDIHFVHR